jgi:pyruvate kinase
VSVRNGKLLSDRINTETVEGLIAKLQEIRASLVKVENDFAKGLSGVHPAWRKGAANLLHYLALRHHDIRHLQEKLALLGLSSLGRSESHVISTVDAVLDILHHLAGRPLEISTRAQCAGFDEGRTLLAAHTEALLGSPPARRGVRIMVTMSTEAADDYLLVRDLLAHGMNCMRINCAHDTPQIWARMVANLEHARRELGLPCRILMDLAGPKLRTGPIQPGPQVVEWHPKRDDLGRVVQPARIWLAPPDGETPQPRGAAACLPIDANWLEKLKAGERINFKDARDRRRILEVVERCDGGVWAQCSRTAYVTPATVLLKTHAGASAGREARVGALPSLQLGIVLKKADKLLLTRTPDPGRPAPIDAAGNPVAPAVISCTLPEIFPQVRSGQRVWFDDGKIGGIIRESHPDVLEVEITHAKPKGDRLLADKGINLPDTEIELPALTPKDLEDLKFIVKHADLVGMSFVRHERDVYDLQKRMRELGGDQLGIVLKIETRQAFERLPNLMLAAMRQHRAGVMIARGDLAVECGYERMAEVQEEMLWICEAAHMPVIWATQVLESLARKGQPSRAEITDAAMGEGAECVMLNKGPHIVDAVSALDDILHRMQDHQAKKSARLRRLHLNVVQEAEDAS